MALGLALYSVVQGQTPVVTARFANPQHDCVSQEYCLDVEFKSDIPDQEIFGVNVRFFYDDELLELIEFRDFQGGYGPVAPDPPIIFTSESAGPALFNFTGPAEFINGAIQLVSSGPPPIYLDTENFTKLFQICFNVDGPIPNLDTFCPPVVWDLEQDPTLGGFLTGDDGLVITIVDPDPDSESYAADEHVEQFNWEYIGDGSPPFGQPVEIECSNINCALPVTLLFFKGYYEPFGNVLEWKTVQEYHLLGFEVQRSQDKIGWKSIGFLESAEENANVNHYQFIDGYPFAGLNYYRLEQKELDGSIQYSPMISITASNSVLDRELIIQPNPVTEGRFSIEVPGFNESGMTFRLLTITGESVLETELDNSISELVLPELPSGLYLASLKNGSQNFVRKVVIQ